MQYKAETRSSAVMGNTISVIIALVGILNFINSMVTAILSRKREFAMLQSIGMTKRQLRNMLICEGLDYAVLTLLASFLISTLMVGVVIRRAVHSELKQCLQQRFRYVVLGFLVVLPIDTGCAWLIVAILLLGYQTISRF